MITRKRCGLCQHPDREMLEAALERMEVTGDELDHQNDWRSGTTAQHLRNHMGEYHNQSNPRCVLCTDPSRATYEVALTEAQLSADALAKALNTTKAQIQRHMKHHLKPIVQQSAANMIASKELSEIDMLSNNVQKLDVKLDELFRRDDMDFKEIDSLTKLAREVRESLKYLLEFKGKLVHKRQDTIIVAQMQIVQEVLSQQHPEVWLDIKAKMQEKMA